MAKYDFLSGTTILQPSAQASDLFAMSATTVTDVVLSATSAAMFVAGASGAACLARVLLKVTVNGTVYYVPCSTVAW